GLFQPAEKLPLPYKAILGGKYPMIFFRKIKQLALNTLKLGSLKRGQSLARRNAVIFSTLNDQDRGTPSVHQVAWIKLAKRFLRLSIRPVPIRSAEIPIDKP